MFAAMLLATLFACYLLFPALPLESASCDDACLQAALNDFGSEIDSEAYDNGGLIWGDEVINNKIEQDLFEAVQSTEAATSIGAQAYERGIIWGDGIIRRVIPSMQNSGD
jgi:hypothetical protein